MWAGTGNNYITSHGLNQGKGVTLHVISFSRPSPTLVLQATNAGVRRLGYEASTEGGSVLSRGTPHLILHNLIAEDNGIIQCVADDPTDMTSTSANTTISVLSECIPECEP